jgi:hypothetical protein
VRVRRDGSRAADRVCQQSDKKGRRKNKGHPHGAAPEPSRSLPPQYQSLTVPL